MGEEKNHFPVIDGHVDLLYELMRHHPNSVCHDLESGPAAPLFFMMISTAYCAVACAPGADMLCNSSGLACLMY